MSRKGEMIVVEMAHKYTYAGSWQTEETREYVPMIVLHADKAGMATKAANRDNSPTQLRYKRASDRQSLTCHGIDHVWTVGREYLKGHSVTEVLGMLEPAYETIEAARAAITSL